MKKKKILLFLATEKGFESLNKIIQYKLEKYIAGVVCFHEIGMQKDFYDDIQFLCLKHNLYFYDWKYIKNSLNDFIFKHRITSCIAISWRYMLPLSINDYLTNPLIIFHDSLLPKYRGFSPLVSAVINGEKKVGATVLYANEYPDCGNIIMQKSFNIDENMYIKDIIKKMAGIYSDMIIEIIHGILNENLKSKPQDDKEATYSVWRDIDDYWINWKLSANQINRFIHALGYPYDGAKTIIDGQLIKIVESYALKEDVLFEIRQAGKIWSLSNGCPTVICGKGLLVITKALDNNNNYYSFTKLRCRLSNSNIVTQTLYS